MSSLKGLIKRFRKRVITPPRFTYLSETVKPQVPDDGVILFCLCWDEEDIRPAFFEH